MCLGTVDRSGYDPRTATWTATGNTHQIHAYNTATLLQDGTVLVTNSRGEEAAASAELYDPSVMP